MLDKTLDFSELQKIPEDEVVAKLTQVKGIGPWTAEMFLMFSLQRPDVFSIGDLGLRSAIAKLYKVDREDTDKVLKISKRWSPYRTLASLYLWKSLDE